MTKVDVLRGMYIRSPGWIKQWVSPLLGLLPIQVRYGANYRRLRQDIERSERDAEFVAGFQLRALRSVIRSCVEYSPHYRELLRDVYQRDPLPEQFSFADFQRIPILAKDAIREDPDRFLTKSASQMDVVSTSGSSGKPLKFFLDKNRSVKEWAFINHIWSRIGYKADQRRAVLRGVLIENVDKHPWNFDPAMNELHLSPFHLTAEHIEHYLELIQKYRVTYLHGYPSAMFLLAKHAQRASWPYAPHIRGLLPISESIYPYQRELLLNTFPNARILPFYGMSEKVAIAGEVPGEPDLYEFEPLYGIAELVDEQHQPIVEIGRRGRLIGTSLLFSGMPLLRYDTGDEAVLAQSPTRENCYRLRVRNIRSRWAQEYLVGANGALISMAAINIHSATYALIQEFQFYQDTPGRATIRIVPTAGRTAGDFAALSGEIMNKIGAGMTIDIQVVAHIQQNKRGKRPFIEQKLDISV